MNYEDMTDFEINKAVTMALGKFKASDYSKVSGNCHKGNVLDCNYSVGVVHDYCSNPADAWAVILENKINLLWNTESTEWEAQAVVTIDMYQPSNCEHFYYDKNPLRAAMIVYLMMNEDKQMRELKFRHYISFTGEMLYSEKHFYCLEDYFSNRQYDSSDEMQFTGLKDKNGVNIYEGDIVNNWTHNPKGLHVVEYASDKYNCGFMARQVDGLGKIHVWYDGLEVIGNIHENPELLESK